MPELVLTREQVRNVDRIAIEEFGIPGIVLMENAGRGCAESLIRRGVKGTVCICCGKGNNGGDGFVIARHLEIHRIPCEVALFADPEELSGDAATNCRILQRSGTPIHVLHPDPDPDRLSRLLQKSEWIVDALLGTGTRGEVREPFTTVIERINQSSKPVLAVDIPSGLDCDTGQPLGPCIEARVTGTFVARKTGFLEPGAERFLGEMEVIGIGIPLKLLTRFQTG
jgi:NAD(P)H-hydrate epimerase